MHALAQIDYIIIFAYFALTMLVGLIMTRKASSDIDEYFLAGRSMPWYMLGVAGMSLWFDLTGTMIITSFLYLLGPRGLFIEFRGGAVLVLAFLLVYAGKWHRRSGCMTLAEWMTYRFGSGKAADVVRTMTALMNIILTVGMLAYLVRGTSLFMGLFFPWTPTTCTLILVAGTTLYTMLSGFYGVVLTDVVQGIIIMVACVLVGVIAWQMVPDAAGLAAVAQQVTGNSDWTSSAMSFHTTMPKGYEQYSDLFMFAMFYLLRNVLGGMGQGFEPRYFAARNDRECGLQSLLQGVSVMLRWPMMIGFAVMGIYLVKEAYPDMGVIAQTTDLIKQHYPQIGENAWHDLTSKIANHPAQFPALVEGLKGILGSGWADKLPLIGFHGTINPENILPAVLLTKTPAGLKGFIIVSMFAALMSTFTGTVNGASAFFVKDIYQLWVRPKAGNRELIGLSYFSTVAVVVLGFAMGIYAESINDLWSWIIMGLTAGTIAPYMLRLYWWRCNAWGIAGGILLGGAGAIIQRAIDPKMVEWQQFILMTTLSFVGTIGGSLLTAPTPMDRLRHFYRTTRPFGWWGPVQATFTPAEVAELTKEHKNDILAVPFVLIWQVTLFLLPMQLVIKSYGSFWKTMPLFLVGVAGMYWFWWRNLPQDEPQAEGPGKGEGQPAEAQAEVAAR